MDYRGSNDSLGEISIARRSLAKLLLAKGRHMKQLKYSQPNRTLTDVLRQIYSPAKPSRLLARFQTIRTPTTPTQYVTKMKATAATSSAKIRVQQAQSKIESPHNACELFLGNKVMSELRILMRLAAPSGTTTNDSSTATSGHSY